MPDVLVTGGGNAADGLMGMLTKLLPGVDIAVPAEEAHCRNYGPSCETAGRMIRATNLRIYRQEPWSPKLNIQRDYLNNLGVLGVFVGEFYGSDLLFHTRAAPGSVLITGMY